MFLGAGEIVVVLAVALMVLGPQKMPEVARKLARFLAQFRRLADEVRSQVDDALAEPPAQKSQPGAAHPGSTLPQPSCDPAASDGNTPQDGVPPSGSAEAR